MQEALIGAVGALAGAIVFLYKRYESKQEVINKRLEKDLEEYKGEHKKDREELMVVKVEVATVKGRQEGIEDLAASVLNEIRSLKGDQPGENP